MKNHKSYTLLVIRLDAVMVYLSISFLAVVSIAYKYADINTHQSEDKVEKGEDKLQSRMGGVKLQESSRRLRYLIPSSAAYHLCSCFSKFKNSRDRKRF